MKSILTFIFSLYLALTQSATTAFFSSSRSIPLANDKTLKNLKFLCDAKTISTESPTIVQLFELQLSECSNPDSMKLKELEQELITKLTSIQEVIQPPPKKKNFFKSNLGGCLSKIPDVKDLTTLFQKREMKFVKYFFKQTTALRKYIHDHHSDLSNLLSPQPFPSRLKKKLTSFFQQLTQLKPIPSFSYKATHLAIRSNPKEQTFQLAYLSFIPSTLYSDLVSHLEPCLSSKQNEVDQFLNLLDEYLAFHLQYYLRTILNEVHSLDVVAKPFPPLKKKSGPWFELEIGEFCKLKSAEVAVAREIYRSSLPDTQTLFDKSLSHISFRLGQHLKTNDVTLRKARNERRDQLHLIFAHLLAHSSFNPNLCFLPRTSSRFTFLETLFPNHRDISISNGIIRFQSIFHYYYVDTFFNRTQSGFFQNKKLKQMSEAVLEWEQFFVWSNVKALLSELLNF